MQFTNILLSLAAVAGVINAAPAPVVPEDVARDFTYPSCLTVIYDTPQGMAFYDIESAHEGAFETHCKACIEATMGCGDADTACNESKFADCAKSLSK